MSNSEPFEVGDYVVYNPIRLPGEPPLAPDTDRPYHVGTVEAIDGDSVSVRLYIGPPHLIKRNALTHYSDGPKMREKRRIKRQEKLIAKHLVNIRESGRTPVSREIGSYLTGSSRKRKTRRYKKTKKNRKSA